MDIEPGLLSYTKPERPIQSPPNTLQFDIETMLRKVPYGLNLFSDFELRCSFEHGEFTRWIAALSWRPADGEHHKITKSGQTATEAVELVSTALG